jgi:hypothetical protein
MNSPQANSPLALADIHLPAGVSSWPPAIGWWLLLALVIALVTGAVIIIKKHRKKWGYRKAALRLLKQTHKTYTDTLSSSDPALAQASAQHPSVQQPYAQQMLALLKRTAVTAYHDSNAKALFGQAWVDFLNQQTPKSLFTGKLAELLLSQQYQSHTAESISDSDLQVLYKACQYWITKHATVLSKTPEPAHDITGPDPTPADLKATSIDKQHV